MLDTWREGLRLDGEFGLWIKVGVLHGGLEKVVGVLHLELFESVDEPLGWRGLGKS